MINRVMRILVFFDLPVVLKEDRKNYSVFRKYLINEGFSMIQYSVYARVTRNHDDARKYVSKLKNNLPPKGSVRVMTVTEKQYNSMIILVGEQTSDENFLTSEDLLEI